jgi:hypothetical protein
MSGVGTGRYSGFHYVGRSGEIGLASAEADDILSCCLQSLSFRVNGKRRRFGDLSYG